MKPVGMIPLRGPLLGDGRHGLTMKPVSMIPLRGPLLEQEVHQYGNDSH